MFGLQTLTCLQNIPVVRSSTNKLHDVYAKAKDTSVLIRLPCSFAETVADMSLQVALTIANPLVKPLRGPVRVIDDFAVQKIRQIESKYPAIKTPTEDVIQHGKESVSNVATATVNKASDVADSVFSFCETHVPGIHRRDSNKATGLIGRVFSPVSGLYHYAFQSVQSSLLWSRMLVVFFLLKMKQINDIVLTKIQHKPFLTILPQQLLIIAGGFLDYFIGRIRPDDRTLADLKKPKQQTRLSQQPQHAVNRPSFKTEPHATNRQRVAVNQHETEPHATNRQRVVMNQHEAEPSVTTRQSVVVTQQETVVTRTNKVHAAPQPQPQPQPQPDYSNMTDKEELYARLAAGNSHESDYHVDYDTYTVEPVHVVSSSDIAELHAQLKPTDVELLYARLPSDVLPDVENPEALTQDQQTLHARLIGAELERQGYHD